jgi:putative sterol carrier protein
LLKESINAKICFAISDASESAFKEWFLDLSLSSASPSIRLLRTYLASEKSSTVMKANPDTKPDVKLYCSDETFLALARGQTSPEMAFMRGLLKIKGPVSIATRIRSLLDVVKPLL